MRCTYMTRKRGFGPMHPHLPRDPILLHHYYKASFLYFFGQLLYFLAHFEAY